MMDSELARLSTNGAQEEGRCWSFLFVFFNKRNYGNHSEDKMRPRISQEGEVPLHREVPIQNDQQGTLEETLAHGKGANNGNILRSMRQDAETQEINQMVRNYDRTEETRDVCDGSQHLGTE